MMLYFSENLQTKIDDFDHIGEDKPKKDFHWVQSELYHKKRRRIILEKYPEIKKLYGKDIRTFPLVTALICAQIALTIWVVDKPLWVILFSGYLVGCTLTHGLFTALHEISHDLVFESRWANRLLSIATNIATGFPSAIPFIRYHGEHHTYMGVDELDPDIPSIFECKIFRTAFMKTLWIFLLPLFYSMRPMIRRPKPPGRWDFLNCVIVFTCDYLLWRFFGFRALAYLMGCTVIGLSLHPVAGHLIAEHYEFVTGEETYSYYGPLNFVNFNVGYHVEHHDFPSVPWTRLPELHRTAKEFYKDLPCYSSYLKVMYHYITSPEMGPFGRIKRDSRSYQKVN